MVHVEYAIMITDIWTGGGDCPRIRQSKSFWGEGNR